MEIYVTTLITKRFHKLFLYFYCRNRLWINADPYHRSWDLILFQFFPSLPFALRSPRFPKWFAISDILSILLFPSVFLYPSQYGSQIHVDYVIWFSKLWWNDLCNAENVQVTSISCDYIDYVWLKPISQRWYWFWNQSTVCIFIYYPICVINAVNKCPGEWDIRWKRDRCTQF